MPSALDNTIPSDSIIFFDEYIHTLTKEPVEIEASGEFKGTLGLTRFGAKHILLSGVDYVQFSEVCEELFTEGTYHLETKY